MVYVTSRPVHPSRSLTEKILEQPRLIQRIRYGIADSARAFLTVFNSTLLERRLAVLLGIPLNGVGPDLQRPLSLAERSREVLPIDRQFDRDRYRGLCRMTFWTSPGSTDSTTARGPRPGVVPHDRSGLRTREDRPDGDRGQPRSGRRALRPCDRGADRETVYAQPGWRGTDLAAEPEEPERSGELRHTIDMVRLARDIG